MKQNGQWLSHVRTRSNTALVEVEPERRARGLLDQHELLEPAAADLELDARLVGLDLVPDDVAHHLAVEREQLVTGEEPGGSAGEPGATATTRAVGIAPVYGVRRRTGRGPGTLDRMPVEKVLLAQPRGFCAGVEMAIKALSWMVRVFEPPVYCYHEIVHNRLVVDRFRELGRGLRRRHRRRPRRRAAHALGPRLGARGRRRGPRPRTGSW